MDHFWFLTEKKHQKKRLRTTYLAGAIKNAQASQILYMLMRGSYRLSYCFLILSNRVNLELQIEAIILYSICIFYYPPKCNVKVEK